MTSGVPPHGCAPLDAPSRSAALWEAARHVGGWLVALFGGPRAIVEMGVLTAKERAEILIWLRPVEALARLLLLADAAVIAAASPHARLHARPDIRPERSVSTRLARPSTRVTALEPQRWSVSFRLGAPTPRDADRSDDGAPAGVSSRRQIGDGAAAGPGDGLLDPWPIAERMEAAIRVLKTPAPFAARLARRLAGRPDRRARLTAAIRGAPPWRARPRQGPADTLLAEARDHVRGVMARTDLWDTG